MIFLAMVFMHILDDYRLQGILASMKQKEWWEAQKEYNPLYKYDYVAALIMHSYSWSFMIMFPIAIMLNFDISIGFVIALFANMIVHCIVDDLKANKKKINLVVDQTIHIIQILITGLIFTVLCS